MIPVDERQNMISVLHNFGVSQKSGVSSVFFILRIKYFDGKPVLACIPLGKPIHTLGTSADNLGAVDRNFFAYQFINRLGIGNVARTDDGYFQKITPFFIFFSLHIVRRKTNIIYCRKKLFALLRLCVKCDEKRNGQ